MKQGFNFLKPQVEPPSAWSYIYEWIVGTARAILIVFEFAVIIALLLRIFVDVQSKSLDAQIQTLENIMTPRDFEEQKYRKLQIKTKSYATLWTSGQIYSEILTLVNQYLPASAVKFDVSLDGANITIGGKALSDDIDLMEKAIKESDLLTNVKLTKYDITNEESQEGFSEEFKGNKFTFEGTLINPSFRTLDSATNFMIEDGVVTE